VPELTSRRRVPPLGRTVVVGWHLGRALGGWALFDRRKGGDASRAGISRRLRIAAERLGPTYIKLGQIISSGEGLFPSELVEEFKACRDQVPAESYTVVREVVTEELGCPIEDVFSYFDRRPLAAASIAQVHRATLRTGEDVVVKVQRPNIKQTIERDMELLFLLAGAIERAVPESRIYSPSKMVSEEIKNTIAAEHNPPFKINAIVLVRSPWTRSGHRVE
jgi:ubiquinone biosynthesis protein